MIIRWVLLIFGGLLLGGIVHLAAVIILPRTATQDAYARLTPIAPVNTIVAAARSHARESGHAVHGPGFRKCRVPLRSFAGTDEADRAGEPCLYVGVLLHAQ